MKGLIKVTSYYNRIQQKKDWDLILYLTGKELKEPDWNLSVKKIDKYMEGVCKDHHINFKDVCGKG